MARVRRQCAPLGDRHRAFLAEEIARLVPRARDTDEPMARVAKFLIDSMLWCWTADGVDHSGNVVRDGIKYDLQHQRHTERARTSWEEAGRRWVRGMRHEHVVPRCVLLKHILTMEAPSTVAIGQALRRFCFSVILLKEEDDLLRDKRLVSRMPDGWTFADGDCDALARYAACGLAATIRTPIIRSGDAG